jgi:Uma2 family endonuclease
LSPGFPLFGDRRAVGFAVFKGRHNHIATELIALILPAARPSRTYSSEMRIETVSSTRDADIFVTCDERDRNDAVGTWAQTPQPRS